MGGTVSVSINKDYQKLDRVLVRQVSMDFDDPDSEFPVFQQALEKSHAEGSDGGDTPTRQVSVESTGDSDGIDVEVANGETRSFRNKKISKDDSGIDAEEVPGEDMPDGNETEASIVLRDFFERLSIALTPDIHQLSIKLYSRGLIEASTRDAVTDMQSEHIGTKKVLQDLECKVRINSDNFVLLVEVLRSCSECVAAIAQEMNQSFLLYKKNPPRSLVSMVSQRSTYSPDTHRVYKSIRPLDSMNSTGEEDLGSTTNNLVREILNVSHRQEKRVNKAKRELELTQLETDELKRQVSDGEERVVNLTLEIQQLHEELEFARQQIQTLKILQERGTKTGTNLKSSSKCKQCASAQLECQEKDKTISRLKEENEQYQKKIEQLNARVDFLLDTCASTKQS